MPGRDAHGKARRTPVFLNTSTLNMYGFLNPAEYNIHILVAASQECVNTYSTRTVAP